MWCWHGWAVRHVQKKRCSFEWESKTCFRPGLWAQELFPLPHVCSSLAWSNHSRLTRGCRGQKLLGRVWGALGGGVRARHACAHAHVLASMRQRFPKGWAKNNFKKETVLLRIFSECKINSDPREGVALEGSQKANTAMTCNDHSFSLLTLPAFWPSQGVHNWLKRRPAGSLLIFPYGEKIRWSGYWDWAVSWLDE